MRIIPAIDIINGSCVRLSEGDFNTSKTYFNDPLDAAKSFEDAGLQFLHLVDLDGAKQRKVANWDVLERIASRTSLKVDFSGGISSEQDIERAIDLGAVQVTVGSLAAKQPEMVKTWLQTFGPETLIIGADVKSGMIATHGWQETSDIAIADFIRDYNTAGGRYFLCTDVSKDGMLAGPAKALYEELLSEVPGIHLIASGGVASMDDVYGLKETGCGSVIIGKAIYENRISLKELESFTKQMN